MFKFLKSVFLAILIFRRPLISHSVKYSSSNNEACLTGPTLSDFVPGELHYYTFVAS